MDLLAQLDKLAEQCARIAGKDNQLQFLDALQHMRTYQIPLRKAVKYLGPEAMVWHHLAALVVYIAVYQKPGTLTAASLTPWSLHAIFWTIHTFTPVSTDSLMWLLVLYNLSLYAVGGICLDCWLRLGPSVMPKAAAFGTLLLVSANYFGYCRDYSGKYCLLASTGSMSELMLKCVVVMLTPPALFALAHIMLRRRRSGAILKSFLPQ
eukprot:jgi/Astpho2/1716/Aster-04141